MSPAEFVWRDNVILQSEAQLVSSKFYMIFGWELHGFFSDNNMNAKKHNLTKFQSLNICTCLTVNRGISRRIGIWYTANKHSNVKAIVHNVER